MSALSGYQIMHHPEKNRFELELGGDMARIEYMKVGSTLIFTHTEVPEALEGKGIAGAMAKFALEYVKENNLTAAPLCPFVKSYIERHPEYKSLIRLG
jgi:predicted GNAT family acetyltransferase